MESTISVRNKIIDCFLETQKDNFDELDEKNSINKRKEFVIIFLKKAFEQTGGNYDKPSKESLQKAIHWLIETAPAPNNTQLAQKHRYEIIQLINSLDE